MCIPMCFLLYQVHFGRIHLIELHSLQNKNIKIHHFRIVKNITFFFGGGEDLKKHETKNIDEKIY